ncbi:MAG: alginate export family protein [Bryobacteraceae bacterium]
MKVFRDVRRTLSVMAFMMATPVFMQAQGSDVTGSQTSAGPGEYLSRTVRFSGWVRERWEATDGPFSATPASSYLLSQVRLGIQFQPSSWFTFFAQAQDARAVFYGAVPGTTLSDPFDLRQAWISVGRREGPGVRLQAGRQELALGSGRLLGSYDAFWANTSRTFDVLHGTITGGTWKSEVVAGSVVQIDPNRMNRHKPGDHVYALYNTFSHILPGASVEPYFIARTLLGVTGKNGIAGDMDTLATGGRVIGKLAARFDYSVEAVHEFGSYANDRLDATALAAGAGWVIMQGRWKPRLSGDYAYASGDDGRKNGIRGTFDNMFGFNQPTNSLTGQFGWKNIKNLRGGVEFFPLARLKVKVDGRNLWLASKADGLYNAPGVRTVYNPNATSAHVGETVEMLSTVTVTRTTSISFGVGTLFPGSYLRQSHKGDAFIYPLICLTQKF